MKRLNIGLFVDDLDAVFTREACKGAEQGAIDIDANMFIFPGGYLDSVNESNAHVEYGYQYNALFSFLNEKQIDVLYIMMGMIGSRVETQEKLEFLQHFSNVPIVTLFSQIEGYPSVTFDNKIGFEHAICHLIEDHNARHVGYVSGPKTNSDAMERLDVYKSVLAKYDIPFREDYVIYGNFEETTGDAALNHLKSHPELEALVFANDRMALGTYMEIEKTDITIGKDVYFVGFDNSVFSASLNPPLSTVEANASDLAYYAVKNANKFLETGTMDNLQIETTFIKRSSCGCEKRILRGSSTLNGIEVFIDDMIQADTIYKYLFEEYLQLEELVVIRRALEKWCMGIQDLINNMSKDKIITFQTELFQQLIDKPLLNYTTIEQLFNMLDVVRFNTVKRLTDDNNKLFIAELFSEYYRMLSNLSHHYVESQRLGLENVVSLLNRMTRDIFATRNEGWIPYASALRNLPKVGINSSYLYLFDKPVIQTNNNIWKHPKSIRLMAYCKDGEAEDIFGDQQILGSNRITDHELISLKKRKTMVLTPIFSEDNLYGVLLCEADWKSFKNIAPVSLQLSMAIKSMVIMEQQKIAQRKLEKSIQKIKANNTALDELSKSDELTGVYNRRGFMECASNAITSMENLGQYAMVIYADMDNLKTINDTYGHDEGDFAIKEMASILKETVRSSDIVARLGGDEFVILAIIGVPQYEHTMKERIAEITAEHNKICKKPYLLGISTGIYEFTCGKEQDLYVLLEKADKKLYEEKRLKKEKK